MKNWKIAAALMGVFLSAVWWNHCEVTVCASQEETIKKGVFAEGIDLSGMTEVQAGRAIADYVEELKDVPVTLVAAGEKEVVTTADALGITWANPELVQEAVQLGTRGNVIERYKAMKDLEHDKQVFDIALEFDVSAINDILIKECAKYDQAAVNMSLKRTKGKFEIIPGQTGYKLDVEASIDIVYDHLTDGWDGQATSIALKVAQQQPRGSAEELAKVKDVLGSFTTAFTSSGAARTANVTNGCVLIDGTTLYPGEEFSTYETVAPFTKANGYYMAASYLNGKVVDSIAGGICQVSTTLYNTVLLAELEVTERHNHSMVVSYVNPASDAAIAESSGKDFRFVNNTDYPIYIEGFIKDKHITINIYGKETRPANRKISYVTEILETIMPPADMIYQDAAQPIGYILNGDSAHIGYKSRLWKVVTVDGKEVSREQVNKSNYKMTPKSATVGVATADPNAYNEIQAAIGTGSIDHVKKVIALLTGQAADTQETGEIIENEEPVE